MKRPLAALISLLSIVSLTQVFASQMSKQSKPINWSVEYSPTSTSTPINHQTDNERRQFDSDMTLSQDSLFDPQRDSPQAQPKSVGWSGISEVPNEQQVAEKQFAETMKQLMSIQLAGTNSSSQWSKTRELENDQRTQTLNNNLDQQIYSIEPPMLVNSMTRAPVDQLGPNHGLPNYITRGVVNRPPAVLVDPFWNALSKDLVQRLGVLKEGQLLNPIDFQTFKPPSSKQASKLPWFKTLGTKRRSFESINDNQIVPRTTNVNFDDNIEMSRFRDLDQSNGKTKDYLASYSSMPYVYDIAPSMERKNIKHSDEDHVNSLDNYIATGSKSIGHSMPSFYTAYPAYNAHVAPRKGLEKSLGIPILVGVGAALISFLIISNLFLSVPLFAMTLLQLLNGNSLLPNNNSNNNGNNPNNTPNNQNGQTTNGRKRRDLHELELEHRIQRAISIDKFSRI